MNEIKKKESGEALYKGFIYIALITLAILIIVPVAWVFLASIKQNSEFYGNPWALPAGFYFQNFIDAWNKARMGEFMLNSVITTGL
ncbi:MAG: carbohydrate ABC transporter permease, partial [Angelakisella sp.]